MSKENRILEQLKKPLNISDVDFRIQSINKGGYATILAYKDARVDMNRLDEVCGALWQDKYELIDGQLFCSIGIKIINEWIWRQDVGTESMTEKQKGRASDAFKRAGFRWGIGRELYDYPLIQVKLQSNEFSEYQGKMKQTFNLKLKEWKWDVVFEGSKVISLTATDNNGALRFNSATKAPAATPPKQVKPKEKPTLLKMNGKDFTKAWINVVEGINKGTIKTAETVKQHYKISAEIEKEIQSVINLTPVK